MIQHAQATLHKLSSMDQAEAAAALHGAKTSKDKEDAGATGEKKAAGGGGASSRGGFVGLMKKKVPPNPKAAAAPTSS